MNDTNLLALLQIIATICHNYTPSEECFAKYETCIQRNHHPEAWPTRSWVCFRNTDYPDDSRDNKKTK